MAISKEQQRELKNLARAANRRLERASAGQRKSLEYNIKGYNVREGKYGKAFSQAAAKTEREYKQRLAELEKFMSAQTSTRKGWESLQRSNIEKATGTLSEMGYDVTEDELEAILKEVGGAKGGQFYKALENVQAFKEETGLTDLTKEDIEKAVNWRKTEYEATLYAIKARNK